MPAGPPINPFATQTLIKQQDPNFVPSFLQPKQEVNAPKTIPLNELHNPNAFSLGIEQNQASSAMNYMINGNPFAEVKQVDFLNKPKQFESNDPFKDLFKTGQAKIKDGDLEEMKRKMNEEKQKTLKAF